MPIDFDNRRDIDLLVSADTNKGLALWRNMRDGTFKDVAKDTGLLGGTYLAPLNVASGDLNKDGFTDFYFAQTAWMGFFALSNGREGFQLKPGPSDSPPGSGSPASPPECNDASHFIDYDNEAAGYSDGRDRHASQMQMELRVCATRDGWYTRDESARNTGK